MLIRNPSKEPVRGNTQWTRMCTAGEEEEEERGGSMVVGG